MASGVLWPAGNAAGDKVRGRGPGVFILWFFVGLLCPGLVLAGAIQLLERLAPQHLPPPALSNRLDLDEKLVFLRRHPDLQPTILGVGSSITMRSLDGAPFSEGLARNSFLNVGFGGAQIHQTREAGKFYLGLFPRVRTVVQLVVPPDFEDCSTRPARLFDEPDARAFVRGEMSSVRAYFTYFNPHELLLEALHIARDRERSPGLYGKLFTDEFGSMPMDMKPAAARARHAELYREVRPLDPRCFRELQEWSREVAKSGAHLVVVVPPFSTVFLRDVADAPQYIEEFVRRLADTLNGEPATVIDEQHIGLGDEAFADAYHLLWPAARVFSRHVSDDVKQVLTTRAVASPPAKPST